MAKKIIIFGLILIFKNITLSQNWYDDSWYFRKLITIDNTENSSELENYQVRISLNIENFDFSKAMEGGRDIRVTNDDGETEIPFWIEFWDPPAANIWIKIPYIPSSSNKIIYLYYGNPNAQIASSGIDTFIFYDGFENFTIKSQRNAPNYLVTPTYDGSGQAIHPDIVYVPLGWNGYEYWMAITPYPYGNSDYENPSIIASHDGINWEVPSGVSNPLVPKPPGGYNNDNDVLMVNNELILFYNETIEGNTNIKRISSSNGLTWSTPLTVFSYSGELLSPTIVYENGNYNMWYVVGGCGEDSSYLYLKTSSDGISWSNAQTLNIHQSNRVIWHIDVQKVGQKYIMILISYPIGASCRNTNLYYAESLDKLNWSVSSVPILSPSAGWDNATIYRSTFLATDDFFRIWYSGISVDQIVHIGYTDGFLDDFIGINEPFWDIPIGNVSSTNSFAHNDSYSLQLIGDNNNTHLVKNISNSKSVNIWLYDDLNNLANYESFFRVWDLGSSTLYPYHSIGLGIYNQSSTGYYVYQSEDDQFFPTSVLRSTGWHMLSINIKNNICDLLVDDQLIVSLDVLDEANIYRFSLDGGISVGAWFDDVFIRELTEFEPSTIVHSDDQSLPVELTSFNATLKSNFVLIDWITESEVNNLGFIITRSMHEYGDYFEISSYLYNDLLIGKMNSNTRSIYKFEDYNIRDGENYWYKLIDVDLFGNKETHGPIKVKSNRILPDFEFYPAYPNPFNQDTRIKFSLNSINDQQRVNLSIYNITGKKIKTILDEILQPGEYEFNWNGRSKDNQIIAGGIYFALLRTKDYKVVQKLILLK